MFYFLSGRSFLSRGQFCSWPGPDPPAASLTHTDGGTSAAARTPAFPGGFLVRRHFQRQLLKKDKCFSFLPSPVHLPPFWMDRTRTLPGGQDAGNDAFGLGSHACSVPAPVASVCVIESLPVWTPEPGPPGIIVVMHLFIILL